jgi:G3E family GTPase
VSDVTPVTVLTGFLGSGKSTLANRMVADPRYADTAVILNDSDENLVTVASGCVCCRVSGNLVGRLRELHFQRANASSRNSAAC